MQSSVDADDQSIPKNTAYLLLQSDFLRVFYRHHCPTSQRLSDFQLGILTEVEAQRVCLHLTQCPHCALEVEELVQFLVKLTLVSGGKPLDRTLPQV
jgi:hypothetical protein